jgi:hypothetical protein
MFCENSCFFFCFCFKQFPFVKDNFTSAFRLCSRDAIHFPIKAGFCVGLIHVLFKTGFTALGKYRDYHTQALCGAQTLNLQCELFSLTVHTDLSF